MTRFLARLLFPKLIAALRKLAKQSSTDIDDKIVDEIEKLQNKIIRLL